MSFLSSNVFILSQNDERSLLEIMSTKILSFVGQPLSNASVKSVCVGVCMHVHMSACSCKFVKSLLIGVNVCNISCLYYCLSVTSGFE